jgi:adenosylhomocysteine nucleosidase
VARLAAVATPVAHAADKARLFAATGAAVVDMESGAVAAVATAAGLPFAVLRVVCDPAGRDLPPAALVALDGDGAIAALGVLASLLRHPGQIPALLRLARDAAAARTGLRALVREVGGSATM